LSQLPCRWVVQGKAVPDFAADLLAEKVSVRDLRRWMLRSTALRLQESLAPGA
jgi:hypothetical protein